MKAWINVTETRKSIAKLLERYRQAGNSKNIVHVVHEVPEGFRNVYRLEGACGVFVLGVDDDEG
jgi:DNA polymerase/3'-5' exonuclease PolX